jgi:hypothetical protein
VTRQQRTPTPRPVVIDACCLIDLLASGQFETILRATGYAWHLPTAVQAEVQYVRQHDPAQPGAHINVSVDLTPHLVSGLVMVCQPDDPQEQARFIQYATIFRSDGEAMCLALAESRGWHVATDDRKAIRIGRQAGLTILSCPELMKTWADATRPDAARLVQVLTDVQTLAQFRPNQTMKQAAWWLQKAGGL